MKMDIMVPNGPLEWMLAVSYGFLLIAFVLGVVRLILGPSIADRVMALDFIALIAMGFLGLTALESRFYAYVDVAIALGLVSFLATVAYARYALESYLREGKGHGRDDT